MYLFSRLRGARRDHLATLLMQLSAIAAAYTVVNPPTVAMAQCMGGAPDGAVDAPEECDDGNPTDTDGCSNSCAINVGWQCAPPLILNAIGVQGVSSGTQADWDIPAPGFPDNGLSAEQQANTSNPTFGFIDNADGFSAVYTFRITVINPDGGEFNDDDFIGFVLGYQDGEATAGSGVDYLLVDWKQSNQNIFGGTARRGLAVSRVSGASTSGNQGNFWLHTGVVNEIFRPSGAGSLGDVGWVDDQTYTFRIRYSAQQLRIEIDGVEQLNVSPAPGETFPAGTIGFYGLSQEDVIYEVVTPTAPSICNRPPTGANISQFAVSGGAVQLGVPSMYVDPDGQPLDAASIRVTSQPTGATATDPGNGSPSGTITVTPNSSAVTGPVVTTYQFCDNDSVIPLCGTATATITFNDPPTVLVPRTNVLGGTATITNAAIQAASSTNSFDGGFDASSLAVAPTEGGTYGTSAASTGGGTCSIVGGNLVYSEPSPFVNATDSCFVRLCETNPGPTGISATNRACDTVEAVFSLDSDGDGIPNAVEGDGNPDGDSLPNYLDIDSDGDGITDNVEGTVGGDGDITPAYLDSDSDDDGVPDRTEGHDANMDGVPDRTPSGEDTDGDGLDDAFDTDCADPGDCDGVIGVAAPVQNSGGAAAADFLDPDDDGDGIPTLADGTTDADGNGAPNFLDPDDDGDGVPTASECSDASDCENRDGTDQPDWLDIDDDNDGIPTAIEGGLSVNTDGDAEPDFRDTDSDGDTIVDSTEGHDADMNGVADVVAAGVDTDGDGLDDAFDTDCAMAGDCPGDIIGVAAPLPNSDDDARPDYQDVDSDGDGITDIVECGTLPCTNTDGGFTGGDANPDYLDTDSDADSVDDIVEGHDVGGALGSNTEPDGIADVVPVMADSDGDGLDDAFDPDCASPGDCAGNVIGVEAPLPDHSDPTNNVPDVREPDDEGDSIPTSTEVEDGNTYGADPDGDGIPAYLDSDSDGDGASDMAEFGQDIDNDGVPDYLDPDASVTDTDGDGIPDFVECPAPGNFADLTGCIDTDGDGVPDARDPDDDNDGISTQQEVANARDQDPSSTTFRDSDGDSQPDYLDLDADNDGIPDTVEGGFGAFDLDRDGIVDTPTDADGDGVLAAFDTDDDDANVTDTPPALNTDGQGGIDSVDLDSDDDGILDIVEGQATGADSSQLDQNGDGIIDGTDDSDGDGLLDAVDPVSTTGGATGDAFAVPDTDEDGQPDFQDVDSDGDTVPDSTEGWDLSNGSGGPPDGRPDVQATGTDSDGDGIDDAFDPDCAAPGDCPGDVVAMAAPLPDFDSDGTPDVRDVDDDGDTIPTADEDVNGNGDPTDDDTDGNGAPNYLDPDDDGDGLDTATEFADSQQIGENPETGVLGDPDGDGIPAWLDPDSDGDGVPDEEEGRDDDDGDGVPNHLDADDRSGERGFAGGGLGCGVRSTEGASSDWWLLGLILFIGWRRKKSQRGPKGRSNSESATSSGARRWLPWITLALLVLPQVASLQRASAQRFNLDRYQPAVRARDGFQVNRPNDLGHLKFGGQIHLDYANDPLVIEEMVGDADSESIAVVSDQLVGHAVLALGLVDRLVLFAGLPVQLLMRGDDSGEAFNASGAGLGDVHAGIRVRFFGEEDSVFALGAQGTVFFPTADAADGAQAFAGEAKVAGHLQALADIRAGRVWVSMNAGVRLRDDADLLTVNVDHEFTYGLGLGIRLLEESAHDLNAHIELYGASSFDNFWGREESPVESIAGLKYHHPRGFSAGVAAGPGFGRGVGSPDVRVVGMIGYTCPPDEEPAPEEPADTDGDGLLDPDDQCPNDPEDRDEFEDDDGCPDPDNDQDGVLDVNDGAPLEPEDKDEFEDADGVPDPDNDADGVLDTEDSCPLEAGPADNQGCPIPDRDGDGVADSVDNCPDEPGLVEYQGCKEKQLVVIADGQLEILDKVYFRTNRSTIEKRSFPLLMNVAQVLSEHPEITSVRVEGHTDARGRHQANMRLSQRRAEAVVKFLGTKGGIDESRLEATGFGPDRPVVENASSAEEHARNRRVEFHIEQANSEIQQQDTEPTEDTID